ncbi:MAG: hypothetical protein A2075_01660 [Geobacteraceae bacterium GWC2_58_44]|nr:MAG: hypothetical protein A2075_01660 [Geobacteraceae bacterium GWC2_58_44]HBG06121.1 hypothetical protein [Geobacter sp.]
MESTVAQAIREWTQFAILIFATGFGIYRFVYKDIYIPSKRTATLTIQSSLEEFGRARESVLIRARIHAVNQTDRTVYVPALWYSVLGLRFGSQEGVLPEYRSRVERSPCQLNARYSMVSEADVVAVGTILTQLTDFYHPADQTANDILFCVPVDRYEAIELRVNFFFTKETRGLGSPTWEVSELGELNPLIPLMGRRYDPERDREHGRWAVRTGAGFNWSVSTLPLLPAISPPAPVSPPAA